MASVGDDDGENTIAVRDRRQSVAATDDGEAADTCRICRGEGTAEQPLFYPCKCSGSIKFVHQECLMEWLSHSQKKYCELCKTSFRFTKLYDQSMPDVLPFPLFLRQIVVYGLRSLGRWLRYFFVILVWTCILPWCIRQIWRGLFWLADGNWMTEHDLHQLMTAQSHSNATTHAATEGVISEIHSEPYASSSVWSVMSALLNSDALLRGLLRLISYKAHVPEPTLVGLESTAGNTNTIRSLENMRRPSMLSEVHALASFTKHQVLNNALIDVLEGQLVCLSVIAAFILVFLIREWVINQQPVHLMPDVDQAPEVPANQVQQDDDARQAVRRRRRNVRPLPEQNVPAEVNTADLAQRPRAIPRPRRTAADAETPPPAPAATSSEGLDPRVDQSNEDLLDTTVDDNLIRSPQDPAWIPLDIQSPPLQRGIFDEAAGIRRSIEEGGSTLPHVDNASHGNDEPSTIHLSPPLHVASEHPSVPPETRFNFSNFTAQNQSQEFTFSHASNVVTQSQDNDGHEPQAIAGADEWETVQSSSIPVFERTADVSGSDEDVVLQLTPQTSEQTINDPGEDGIEDLATEAEEQPNTQDEDVLPQTVFEKIAKWLWQVDPATNLGNNGRPAENDQAAALIEAIIAPQHDDDAPPAPAAPVAPVHEPNVQFGIDLNDPNAMDDAEDLEGILELIGMEGPIAGMIQNIIFSVFLITLTLSASVWCPYIWGKIALLIMSNPVGIFVKAPLYFVSKVADVIVDLLLLTTGLMGFVLSNIIRVFKVVLMFVTPTAGRYIKVAAVENLAVSITQTSSTRLEKALSVTVFHLRPDLPTFSMQSHHALRVFRSAFSDVTDVIATDVAGTISNLQLMAQINSAWSLPLGVVLELASFPSAAVSAFSKSYVWFLQVSSDLKTPVFADAESVDLSLIEWGTKDKILAILIGYAFFAIAGVVYLKVAHFILGLKDDEEVQGLLADSLRQAGGVTKVIVIIGIEMIVFPLYCGCLLDVALLPLFQEASLQTRLAFVAKAPMTGVFIHWFIGTCYMFHFALFVSMCRKIMRRGVLYFIRDPDDPTFHPVRDVLERPVATQLSKIAFSACVYGGLVLVCLGGVVWSISRVSGIFPVHWATNEPRLAFPVDLIFFNFILPFAVRKAEPSKRISTMYEWWFRKCARALRLSHFLFDEMNEAEMRPLTGQVTTEPTLTTKGESQNTIAQPIDGSWVRAPAADSVRIPRGTRTFLEVTENNEQVDGLIDREKGIHGKDDERFKKIFIPSKFRLRIAAFIFLVWAFAASTGALTGIAPLLIGRKLIMVIADSKVAPNDLYAFTVGVHVCGFSMMAAILANKHKTSFEQGVPGVLNSLSNALSQIAKTIKYAIGLLYLMVTLGIVLPLLLSFVAEMYIHMPVYSLLLDTKFFNDFVTSDISSNTAVEVRPTIFVVQSWTLGILYLRLLLRLSLKYPDAQSQFARAIRSTVRRGVLHPDVRLASRAFILPAITSSLVLLSLPPVLARSWILATGVTDSAQKLVLYRCSYPLVLATLSAVYGIFVLRQKIEGWQTKVRDEVYLVGERLHNFSDPNAEAKKALLKARSKGKGKGKENVSDSSARTATVQSRQERPSTNSSSHPPAPSVDSSDHASSSSPDHVAVVADQATEDHHTSLDSPL